MGQQEPYCAFEVVVKSPSNTPAANIEVTASVGINSKPFATRVTDTDGIARICDVPMGTRISVDAHADGGCGAVTVRGLTALWMETRRVFMTFQPCSTGDFYWPSTCHLLLRVRDDQDHAVLGAKLMLAGPETVSQPGSTLVSDSFGRIFQVLRSQETLRGHIDKRGYDPADVLFECRKLNSPVDERRIVLRKAVP